MNEHPAFDQVRPTGLDHKNLPKPNKPATSTGKPAGFTCDMPREFRPENVAVKPAPAPGANAAKVLILFVLFFLANTSHAQFSTNRPDRISFGSTFGTNGVGTVTNTGSFNTNPPAALPSAVAVWGGTNNPNGLISAGYGSLYNQFDATTGTNLVQQWVKLNATGNTNWGMVVGGSAGAITNGSKFIRLAGTNSGVWLTTGVPGSTNYSDAGYGYQLIDRYGNSISLDDSAGNVTITAGHGGINLLTGPSGAVAGNIAGTTNAAGQSPLFAGAPGNGGGLTNLPTIQFRLQNQARNGVNIGDRIVAGGNWWFGHPNGGGAMLSGDDILPGGAIGNDGGGTNSYSQFVYTNCSGAVATIKGAVFANPQLMFAISGYATPAAITVDATIEYPLGSGNFSRFYFNGNYYGVVLPDCLAQADLFPAVIVPNGSAYGVRTYVTLPATNNSVCLWRVNSRTGNLGFIGQTTNGNSIPDLTTNATGLTYNNAWAGYAPSAILAETETPTISIGIMGDSELGGGTSYYGASGAYGAFPLWGMFTNAVPIIQTALSGNALFNYYPDGTSKIQTNRMELQLLAKTCTDVMIELSENDWKQGRTFGQITNILEQMGWYYSNRGVRPWLVTDNPYAMGTFAATNTQGGVYTTNRAAVNAWKRSVPAPFYGCFDQATNFDIGGTNDANIWFPNMTTDGTHPAGTALAQTNWLAGWAAFITNTVVGAANR